MQNAINTKLINSTFYSLIYTNNIIFLSLKSAICDFHWFIGVPHFELKSHFTLLVVLNRFFFEFWIYLKRDKFRFSAA